MKLYFICLLLFAGTLALKDIGQLNLVKVEMFDVVYKKLMVSEEGILSAPPLTVLDVSKLKNYKCFLNLRSKRWSLAIPILFWNQTYMDKVTKDINMVDFFKKFKPNVSSMILPPSGILAYKLNWRRKADILSNNDIVLDSSWYTSQFDYVLPRKHDFIMEFHSQNNSIGLCNSTKESFLNEPFQSQELAVTFMTRKVKAQNISKISITIRDVKMTKMFNETGCSNKEKCYVSYKYAEKWSYEVSSTVMDRLNVVHLSLQKDIYDSVLNYLCKEKVPIADIESQTITKLVKDSSNEMGCVVEMKIYSTLERLCRDRVFNNHYYSDRICFDTFRFFEDEVIVSMNSTKTFDERPMFNIHVRLWQ